MSIETSDHALLEAIQRSKQEFGVKCSKFAGAVTVEMLKSALIAQGIHMSPRDVFIKGVPSEIDILFPKRAAKPQHDLIYEPSDVLAVLEVKNAGSFGDATLAAIRRTFGRVQRANSAIYCAYVTLIA